MCIFVFKLVRFFPFVYKYYSCTRLASHLQLSFRSILQPLKKETKKQRKTNNIKNQHIGATLSLTQEEAHDHIKLNSLSTISRPIIQKSVADNRSNSEQATQNMKSYGVLVSLIFIQNIIEFMWSVWFWDSLTESFGSVWMLEDCFRDYFNRIDESKDDFIVIVHHLHFR